jgi:hypothetical protein
MTVYYLEKKWIIRDKKDLYTFIKHYKINQGVILRNEKVTETLVRKIAAQVDYADFVVYESYGFIYVYEFLL